MPCKAHFQGEISSPSSKFESWGGGGETGVKCRVWRGCIFLPVTESLQEKLTVTERLPHDVVVGVWGRGGKGKRGEGENLRNKALQFRS